MRNLWFLVVILIAGCGTSIPSGEAPTTQDGYVRLSIPPIPQGEATTRVIPDYATQFRLGVAGSGWVREVTADRATSGDTVIEMTCPPGVGITVTVDALDSDGVDVASATETDVTVVADQTTSLTLTLNAFTGRLEITVQ
jgi:hypothetical protein